MKRRYPVSIIAWLLALVSIGVTICTADQAARYVSNQDKKQLFLAEMKEDIPVLASCLHPQYRRSDMKPEFTIPPEDVSKIISGASSQE